MSPPQNPTETLPRDTKPHDTGHLQPPNPRQPDKFRSDPTTPAPTHRSPTEHTPLRRDSARIGRHLRVRDEPLGDPHRDFAAERVVDLQEPLTAIITDHTRRHPHQRRRPARHHPSPGRRAHRCHATDSTRTRSTGTAAASQSTRRAPATHRARRPTPSKRESFANATALA